MSIATLYGLGMLLQVVGLLVMVVAAWRTAGRMLKYQNITFAQLGQFLNDIAAEFRGVFKIQAIGFIVAVAGMTLSTLGSLQSLG